MSSKQDVWMPLFIGDYLRDTTRLTTEKHGAYLLLIMDYWINGAPPDDDEVLASITKMQIAAWRKAKPALQQLFIVVDGKWQHKRIDEELLKASENATKYAERSKKANDKRWNKESKNDPSRMQEGSLDDYSKDPTSPSPSSKEQSNVCVDSNLVPNQDGLTHTQIQTGLIAQGLTRIGLMPFNPTLPEFIALIDAGATVDEFVNTALEKKGDMSKFNFKYLIITMTNRRVEAAKAKPLHVGALPATNSREAGRNAAAKSIFTPELTKHLQGNNFKTLGVENEVRAITE